MLICVALHTLGRLRVTYAPSKLWTVGLVTFGVYV